ncbi:MAG TPA: putative nucleotidyltransferase substrate binding domain-containing protein, partial [Alphaproteobacteria bacterium]|nr:putative nucleotidyltransferase substrate binding domain-containing protein [Alphaproteobacteria bacterium]
LHPDQDNGLVLEDYPDDRHDAVDAWFRAFAARLTAGMDAVGLPLCRGHVMATNPLWRKSLSQWRGQLDYWLAHRNPAVLRWADIFFDFRGVWGEPGLAGALRETVTDRLAGNVRFLRAMVRDDEDNDVALGLFHRFVLERSDPATRGRVNLKLGATLPLTDSVRVLALRQGIAETSTLARIAGLLEAGVLDSDEADALSAGYAEISAMLLRQQLADWRAGRPLGNHVDPHALTGRERDHLVAALKAIRGVLDLARMELTGFVL